MREHVLQPAGFSTDVLETPSADAETVSFVPSVTPLVSVPDADWVVLDNPEAGRMRATANGLILGVSRGPNREGYAICLRCGRAEPEIGTAAETSSPFGSHKRLRRGREQLTCDAEPGGFAIQRNLRLGYSRRTDICEFQLAGIDDEQVAITCAVALREGLSRELGIERDEIGWHVERRQGVDGQQTWSLLLFDTAAGGAGYASAAVSDFHSLVRAANTILDCSNPCCTTACPSCLITRDTTQDAEKLDRKAAGKFLGELEKALTLPVSLRVFGPNVEQWMSARPLPAALDQALELPGADRLVLALNGNPAEWDLVGWWGEGVIERHARRGLPIFLAVGEPVLRTLTFDTLIALNSLIQRGAPNVRVVAAPAGVVTKGTLAAIRTAGNTRAWATIDAKLGIITPPPEGVVVASGLPWVEPEAEFDMGAAISRVRPALSRIDVRRELDGSIVGFGGRFWQLVQERSADARAWLGRGEITRVEYQDRYLFNPLAVALLVSVLRALPARPDGGTTARPTAVIRTMADRATRVGQAQPSALFHDWRDIGTRDHVLKAVVSSIGFNASIEALPRHTLPHGRNLLLHSLDGATLDIMLDQGFGYWRSKSGSFDFAARPTEQATAVARVDATVVGASEQPTTLIVDLTKASTPSHP